MWRAHGMRVVCARCACACACSMCMHGPCVHVHVPCPCAMPIWSSARPSVSPARGRLYLPYISPVSRLREVAVHAEEAHHAAPAGLVRHDAGALRRGEDALRLGPHRRARVAEELSKAGLARVSGRSIFSLLGWGSSPVRHTCSAAIWASPCPAASCSPSASSSLSPSHLPSPSSGEETKVGSTWKTMLQNMTIGTNVLYVRQL